MVFFLTLFPLQVPASSFGLTDEQILQADEAELNRWAPLRKLVQYRTPDVERMDIKRFSKRANNKVFEGYFILLVLLVCFLARAVLTIFWCAAASERYVSVDANGRGPNDAATQAQAFAN